MFGGYEGSTSYHATVKIETRDGLTFTVDEFESYLHTQIAKLTDK